MENTQYSRIRTNCVMLRKLEDFEYAVAVYLMTAKKTTCQKNYQINGDYI